MSAIDRSDQAERRRVRVEEQRVDAAKVRDEIAAAAVARDAKTDRLRALRLAKEAADREAAAATQPKPKRSTRKPSETVSRRKIDTAPLTEWGEALRTAGPDAVASRAASGRPKAWWDLVANMIVGRR